MATNQLTPPNFFGNFRARNRCHLWIEVESILLCPELVMIESVNLQVPVKS